MPFECSDLAALAWVLEPEDQVIQGLYEWVEGMPNSDPLLFTECEIPELDVTELLHFWLLGRIGLL
jgi:hypothetical protein